MNVWLENPEWMLAGYRLEKAVDGHVVFATRKLLSVEMTAGHAVDIDYPVMVAKYASTYEVIARFSQGRLAIGQDFPEALGAIQKAWLEDPTD